METIPLSLLPREFNYYAGGHIHQKSVNRHPGYDPIVFPGPLFLGNARGRDLESTARGEERGFYIVSFDDDVRDIEFVENRLIDGIYREYSVSGLNASQARLILTVEISKLDVRDKMVVLKIKGELAGGKTTDIDFPGLRNLLTENGATSVYINRFGVTSKEYTAIKVRSEDRSIIAERLFKENIGTVKVSVPALQNASGVALSLDLFKSLMRIKGGAETKTDYEQRVREDALDILSLKGGLEE
jgi:DNA repair exonuclease SbcCD nuclease subunit